MNNKKSNGPAFGMILTTGAIAHYCETTVKQVNRWIKSGKLPAFQTPGGHYRVSKDEFRKFLERHDIPVIEDFFKESYKKKILVADDDVKMVKVICDILQVRYKELELETAYDGYEALITAGNFQPDLMILDIRMPQVDGLEVCRRLRDNKALSSKIKILAMTAHTESYDRDTVIAAGADEYLVKPVDIKTLVEHIDKMI